MIAVSGIDPLHDETMKSHEQNEKDYEAAMKENKDAVNLVSGDNTKKKNEKVKKSSELKKMHLSESLFEDMFDSDEVITESGFSATPNKDKLFDLMDDGMIGALDVATELIKYCSDDDIADVINNLGFEDLDESVKLSEADDFLDKVAKKVVGVHESLDEEKKTLNEDENELNSSNDIANTILDNYPKYIDVYDTKQNDEYTTIVFKVDGDWKHDHIAFKYWMDKNASELLDCDVKFGGEEQEANDDSDDYTALYTYYFVSNDISQEQPIDDEPADDELEDTEFIEEEPVEEPVNDESEDEQEFDDDSIVAESLKYKIAEEQLKRFNECKMPKDWSPYTYLENLVNKNHITEDQKTHLEETLLNK